MKNKQNIPTFLLIFILIIFMSVLKIQILNLEERITTLETFVNYQEPEEEYLQIEEKITEFKKTEQFKKYEKNSENITNKEQLFSISESDTYYILFYMPNEPWSNKSIVSSINFGKEHELYYMDISTLPQNEFYDSLLAREIDNYDTQVTTKDNFKLVFFPTLIEVKDNTVTAIISYNNIKEFVKE